MNYSNEKSNGITLIALIITIIVLLILAGITIGAITSNNSILKQSVKARNDMEISEELESVRMAANSSMINNQGESIDETRLESYIKNQYPTREIDVKKNDDNITISFIDKERYYTIDILGEISGPTEVEKVKDTNPGDITKDKDGNPLNGLTLATAYEINCIEDLCAFSNESATNMFLNKYIKLMVDLDFESKFSYINGNIGITGKIPSCNSIDSLRDILTNKSGEGFYPIAKDNSGSFGGTFEGNNKTISNLYINLPDMTYIGLFSATRKDSSISNLTVSGEITGKIVGGICGYAGTLGGGRSKFYNCTNYCTINGKGGAIRRNCRI